jgi:N-acetylglucosaminyl-diphospho-decaprenol L-rhamnosyltransferase
MKVSAIVIVTGPEETELMQQNAPALLRQVDELVVVANGPGSVESGEVPDGARLLRQHRLEGFSANINAGTAVSTAEYVVVSNPDVVPEPDAVAELVRFADDRRLCGVAGPKMINPDGTLQASRRRFPTVAGTIARRTPIRLLFPPLEWQRRHYLLDAPVDAPMQVDTMLGAFLLMRRTMLEEIGGWDDGYQLYVEDIDLSYRAMKAGWERWWVPSAVVHHEYQAVIDKRFFTRRNWWHVKAMGRFLRKHPERLLAFW